MNLRKGLFWRINVSPAHCVFPYLSNKFDLEMGKIVANLSWIDSSIFYHRTKMEEKYEYKVVMVKILTGISKLFGVDTAKNLIQGSGFSVT